MTKNGYTKEEIISAIEEIKHSWEDINVKERTGNVAEVVLDDLKDEINLGEEMCCRKHKTDIIIKKNDANYVPIFGVKLDCNLDLSQSVEDVKEVMVNKRKYIPADVVKKVIVNQFQGLIIQLQEASSVSMSDLALTEKVLFERLNL